MINKYRQEFLSHVREENNGGLPLHIEVIQAIRFHYKWYLIPCFTFNITVSYHDEIYYMSATLHPPPIPLDVYDLIIARSCLTDSCQSFVDLELISNRGGK